MDLRALMAKAAEMVSMAERYRVALAQQARPTGARSLPVLGINLYCRLSCEPPERSLYRLLPALAVAV